MTTANNLYDYAMGHGYVDGVAMICGCAGGRQHWALMDEPLTGGEIRDALRACLEQEDGDVSELMAELDDEVALAEIAKGHADIFNEAHASWAQ